MGSFCIVHQSSLIFVIELLFSHLKMFFFEFLIKPDQRHGEFVYDAQFFSYTHKLLLILFLKKF